ncbi:hypothetical protein, partial [Streptomyces sp. NPDC127092]|uniref:hypothetical protein n=1 Tax=Streptomyces sp. NPDC127092 TaxID=3347135 RepID=UPI00365DDFAD
MTLTLAELGGTDGAPSKEALQAAFERLHAARQEMAPAAGPTAAIADTVLRRASAAAGLLRPLEFR